MVMGAAVGVYDFNRRASFLSPTMEITR